MDSDFCVLSLQIVLEFELELRLEEPLVLDLFSELELLKFEEKLFVLRGLILEYLLFKIFNLKGSARIFFSEVFFVRFVLVLLLVLKEDKDSKSSFFFSSALLFIMLLI